MTSPSDPSSTEPSSTEPPGTEPSSTEPSSTEPPGTDPPNADPPASPPSGSDRRGSGAGSGPAVVGCVFVGTSLDGFIARENGDLDWLTAAGAALGETGYDEFFASVDALVLGRGTFEVVSSFASWPYPGKRVLVLSRTLALSETPIPVPAGTPQASAAADPATSAEPGTPPEAAEPAVTVHASLDDVLATLTAEGRRRVYVDGGRTIQSFLRAGLIREITITRAPVLIGSGIPLFGPLAADVHLRHVGTRELGAGFTQSSYEVLAET